MWRGGAERWAGEYMTLPLQAAEFEDTGVAS